MEKIWKIKPRTNPDLLEQLLENRGISGQQAAADFLQPDYANLHDPFLFKGMDAAVARIQAAIKAGEKILIYSDYDADAITANAVAFRCLQWLGADVSVYIPDRFTEGYGLNLEAFEKIKDGGVKVVITVDCGTNSVAEAEFCKANGMDLIITDHHELTGELPDALAVINPKLPGTSYPYHEITGVGVAFKLACALLQKQDKSAANAVPDGYEKWLLDLVAIGTVADCHSLIGENRILVKYGLKVLQKTKWIGLAALMQAAKVSTDAPLDTYVLGFIIAPRINAAGRIDHASIAFDLLASDDPLQAAQLAERLEDLNSKRQALTENVMSEARIQLTQISDRKILMASGSDWPKGVVGLVAGKLVEEFARPVIVLERGEHESTGSARSFGDFNLVEALNYSKSVLVRYGGHAAAAGFTVRTADLDLFYKHLLDYAEENIGNEPATKVIEVEAEVKPEELGMQTLAKVQQLEPFGVDNRKPLFLIRNAQIRDLNAVGKTQKHLQMTLVLPGSATGAGKTVKCIGFNFGHAAQQYLPGDHIDAVFEMLADTWQGITNLKLRIIDFRKAENV